MSLNPLTYQPHSNFQQGAAAYEEFVGDTPVNGNHTPVNGNHTPVNGNHTPVNGNHTPVNGNHTPVNGNYTPVSGNYTSVISNYKQATIQRQAFSYNDKFKRTYFANNYLQYYIEVS